MYEELKMRYSNCTYVDGNLELTNLDGQDNYDLSFLSDIREVTGYVLVMIVFSDVLPLTSLRIIRGRKLYTWDDKHYSLYVAKNYKINTTDVGIKELQLNSLHEILNGDVFLFNNNLLCHADHVLWMDILSGEGANFDVMFTSPDYRAKCEPCHESCEINGERHCWGDGPNMCQKLTKTICSEQCESRCFGTEANMCCHPECAGGCTGPTKNDCWACKNFNNGGRCEPFCPKQLNYNPDTFLYDRNPDAKYTYGSLCVEECPAHLLVDNGACVSDCGYGRVSKNQECVECDGPCPKTCPGTGEDFLHAGEIDRFAGCTVIQGNIKILTSTFDGDPYRNISQLHPRNFSVFENVQEITGHLTIQGKHTDFVDVSFFKNLRIIHGRELDNTGASINVYATSLEKLALVSLESVKNGMILISRNKKLCYSETIDWNNIISDSTQRIIVSKNRPEEMCVDEGFECDSQCSDSGCWGPGPRMCRVCANYHLENVCLNFCNESLGMYDAGNKTCKRCHPECAGQCSGPGNDHCARCQNVKDGPYCVQECPETKYPDENDVCQMCHANCVGGCTGPENNIGTGACNLCEMAVIDNGNITKCLPPDSQCEVGYYQTIGHRNDEPMFQKMVCKQCHPECKRCSQWGDFVDKRGSVCEECVHYEENGRCVSNCSTNHFADEARGKCNSCHPFCADCRGPTAADCFSCAAKHFKVSRYVNVKDGVEQFNCTDECPPEARHKSYDDKGESFCITDAVYQATKGGDGSLPQIIGPVVGISFAIAVVLVAFLCHRRAKAIETKLRLTAKMSGYGDESEPLTPTDAKPDMASLRLVKESELRRGNIIGSGAFGTVYKGVWVPANENVKIPVAIKVLQEGTSPNQNKELLEEARIMASVDHPCCIRILAVCMTAQMMLITQLMPLGCLLDYVRKHKANIGSKVLLNWCTQIAKGMAYLETEKGIVHRDLAARNVLVQSPNQVKITDFGLAKLLDYEEEEFHGTGGKMPIKWLALECIQHRVFTHKSDVWSFGVTMWELFTFGQRPYENVRARDIPDLLSKGERLPQPSICTIDVYMIMIKCWMLDAQSRPNFKELADEFAKMARDPGRYLVITGDKLLRLPSHSYDSKDLVRNMSIAGDGPEEIIDAEEYLQPQLANQIPLRHNHKHNHNPHVNGKLEKVPYSSQVQEESPPPPSYADERLVSPIRDNSKVLPSVIMPPVVAPPPLSTASGATAATASAPLESDYPTAPRREKKYSGLEAAAAARKQREIASPNARDSVKSRYSSDPCKVLGGDALGPRDSTIQEETELDDLPPVPAPPTPMAGAQPPNIKLRLPVDEDDYLQPKSSNPAAYMDLVPEDYLPVSDYGPSSPGDKSGSPPPPLPQPYMDMRTAIDNPEYFDSPLTGPQNGINCLSQIGMDGLKSEKTPLRLRSMSSESEGGSSEHDYYNETDQLNRQKKKKVPVMIIPPRTESTV